MSLQQQVEEEMQREARIDQRIEKLTKLFFREPSNRKYKVHPSKKGADAVLIFERKDTVKYSMFLYKEGDKNIELCLANPSLVTLVFLKDKNQHDAKRSTYGHIKSLIPRESYKH